MAWCSWYFRLIPWLVDIIQLTIYLDLLMNRLNWGGGGLVPLVRLNGTRWRNYSWWSERGRPRPAGSGLRLAFDLAHHSSPGFGLRSFQSIQSIFMYPSRPPSHACLINRAPPSAPAPVPCSKILPNRIHYTRPAPHGERDLRPGWAPTKHRSVASVWLSSPFNPV